MPWTFEITTGNMYGPDGSLAGNGYAGGNLGKDPEGKDNPADEEIPDVGPLPEGLYQFGELVLHHPKLGAYCFRLILVRLSPNAPPGSEKRGGFWCHGDTTPPGNASEGCVVQPHPTRVAMHESADQFVNVAAIMA